MAERLGNVLYWLGIGIAALMVAFSAYMWRFATNPEWGIWVGIFLTIGAVAWLIGRACRYVLGGR